MVRHTLFLVACLVGCSSSGAAPTSGSTSDAAANGETPASEPADDCLPPCQAKAAACGAPAGGDPCADLCAGAPSRAFVDCLVAKSCQDLASAEDPQALCSDRPTADSGAGGGGGECKPGCTPSNDGVIACRALSGGQTVPVTERCTSGTCKEGRCGACTKKEQCAAEGNVLCSCADGKRLGTSVDYDCVSGTCQRTGNANCEGVCRNNGGAQT
jgi:hypothetical protein